MSSERLQNWTDDELLAGACADPGSDAARLAASVLLQRYHVRVFQWCNAQLTDPDLASDVAQEVLLKAYRSLGGFAGRSRFSSWLFAIARNRCLDELRRPRWLTDDEAVDELPDLAATPAAAFEARASEEEWDRLLRRYLEPAEHEAVVLRYFECLPVDEITRVLGLAQASGARGLLQRAKRKLRAALAATGRSDHV